MTIAHESGCRFRWESGEYTGTVSVPKFERLPMDIEWDTGDLPSNWESLEDGIRDGVNEFIGANDIKC